MAFRPPHDPRPSIVGALPPARVLAVALGMGDVLCRPTANDVAVCLEDDPADAAPPSGWRGWADASLEDTGSWP